MKLLFSMRPAQEEPNPWYLQTVLNMQMTSWYFHELFLSQRELFVSRKELFNFSPFCVNTINIMVFIQRAAIFTKLYLQTARGHE